MTHDQRLIVSKLESGQSEFICHEDARLDIEARKRTIREIKKGIAAADDGRLVDHADLKAG